MGKLKNHVGKIRSRLLLILLLAISPAIFGQNQYSFNGTVTESGTDGPLPGASVFIKGTSFGTITDFDGNYTFNANLNPGPYSITISSLGFSTQNINIELGSGTNIENNVSLVEDLLSLDEVIVTGNSVGVNKRTLGNAISTVKAADLKNNAATAVDQALSGKIAGALVQQNSGDPAGGISIRLRGASTISGSSDPLYIIDGVLVNNSSNQLIDLGGNTQNRLVDINPNDIDRIEVIKGAAAAAIYGSRASNGVVQIFTKRGKTGKPRFSFTTNTRLNSLRQEIAVNEVPLAWVDPFDNTNLETVPVQRFNLQDEIFETGFGVENFLSVSGGSENTQYFVSGSFLNNEGIVKNTDFERYGLKINLDQKVNDWISFTAGLNYVRSESNDIPNGGIAAAYGALTGFYFSDNSIDPSPDESGVFPVTSPLVARTNPAEAVARFDFGQKTNRVIASIGTKMDFTERLSANYVIGFDYSNQSGTAFIPPGNTSPQATGFARRADANNFLFNNDLNLSYTVDVTEKIKSTTVLGGTWQYQERETLAIESDRLPPLVEVASGGTIIGQTDSRFQESFWGAFLQQTFSFNEKLYLNGAVRYDGASVFGEDERNQIYAKVSASYVVSDEDFWKDTFGSAFNIFKLRASWGQAGNLTALSQLDRLSLFNPIAINGNSGLVPSQRLGNEDVAPERQEEFEIGFDAGFLDNRLGIEFTYYNQQISDLLLQRELSPSTGFSTRFENIGELENQGIEILLRAAPIKTKDFSWDITTTFATNNNEVTNVPGNRIGLAGSFGSSFVIEGESLGVFFRSFYDRDASGNIIFDANGFPSAGTAEDGGSARVIGDPNPEWFGSLINEFAYKNFTFRLQLDAVQGFDILNFNRRLADNGIFGGGPNVGQELLGNLPKGLGGRQAGIFEEFVEDGSFVKLRELALGYTFYPKNTFVNTVEVTLVGRNLISWDDYTGFDPEVNTPGQSNGVRGFDFASVPIPRTFQLGFNVSF